MNNESNDITLKKSVLEMLTVANEYCYYFEHLGKKTHTEILEFVSRIGPLLYLKGSLIPNVEVENPEADERFFTPEEWETLFYALRKVFGKYDEFRIIDPQYINENEPLKASLSESMTDIYQDMKDFILLYQRNTYAARQNAVKGIRKLYATHWGYRITNILPKVHHLLYEEESDSSPFI